MISENYRARVTGNIRKINNCQIRRKIDYKKLILELLKNGKIRKCEYLCVVS